MSNFSFCIERVEGGKWVSTINGKKIITYNHPSLPNTLNSLLNNHVKGFKDLISVDEVGTHLIKLTIIRG